MKFFAPLTISENISKTPEGYLLCRNVAIGRTGEMEYGVSETPIPPGPDGKVYVTRTAEELFRPETVASFEGKPVTIMHPQDFVDPKSWRQLTMGIVQNVRRGTGENENDLLADFLITVEEAIELVQQGLREVSCGYEAVYTQTGIGRGFQTNILGNHVALVQRGRAGESYAINDHKEEDATMSVKESIKKIFGKAQDDALALVSDQAAPPKADQPNQGFVTLKDMTSYMDTQFSKLMDAMSGKKEEQKDSETNTVTPQPEAKDEEGASGLEARIAKLEELVAKLVGAQAGDESGEEVSEDADEEEEKTSTGDSAVGGDEEEEEVIAARAEILAPGLLEKSGKKNLKAKALLAAYATKDGKSVIDTLTGGKAPNTKDAKVCDALFIGASEILKARRSDTLGAARESLAAAARAKDSKLKGAPTPEDINAANEKFYGKK